MEQAQAVGSVPKGEGQAHIRFGVYNQPGPHVGSTVKEVREKFSKLWGIPSDATAYLGGKKLEEDYQIGDGENIEFHRKAGEKG